MYDRLRSVREKRANGDRGFTLIELLVVVVIIGVLVAIAIPVFLNYRRGAENRSAQSDVRNAITTVEQCYSEGGNKYPTAAATGTGPAAVTLTCGAGTTAATGIVNLSQNNVFTYTSLGTGDTYKIAIKNTNTNATFTYTSADGQTVKS